MRYKEERQKQKNNIMNLSRLASELKKDEVPSSADEMEEKLPLNNVPEEMEVDESMKHVNSTVMNHNTNSNIIHLS